MPLADIDLLLRAALWGRRDAQGQHQHVRFCSESDLCLLTRFKRTELSDSVVAKTCNLALFRALEDAIDLGSHDEIVLVQSFDLFRA